MRVGRVSAIRFMPYRDVRPLMRYHSIKKVAISSSNQNNLSKINTLQPYDPKDIKQQLKVSKAKNNIVLDAYEKSILENEKNLNNRIDIIKDFKKARKGSRINALKMLADSQVNSKLFPKKRNYLENKQQDNIDKTDKKNRLQNNTLIKNNNDKKELSIIEKYAKQLKEITEAKNNKKIFDDKKNKELEKEKSIDKYKRAEKDNGRQEFATDKTV